MKQLKSIPKILKINDLNKYEVSCLFDNGESRIIDFETFFKNQKNFSEKHPAYILMQNMEEFKQIEIIGTTIGWKNTGVYSRNMKGETVFYHFDLDPIVLFENSVLDENRNIDIGLLIKSTRKEIGLTQEELAEKSGTNKSFISKLENSKLDVELSTLQKIIEGLGKKLKIQIA
ncbi:MAG: helix-turn-helix domain-containing protein [Chitinophagales bacterium]